jgi:hypothetical protein
MDLPGIDECRVGYLSLAEGQCSCRVRNAFSWTRLSAHLGYEKAKQLDLNLSISRAASASGLDSSRVSLGGEGLRFKAEVSQPKLRLRETQYQAYAPFCELGGLERSCEFSGFGIFTEDGSSRFSLKGFLGLRPVSCGVSTPAGW